MLGTIEGSAGGLTFTSTAGVNIMKQKVGKNNSNSPLQQQQRAKFATIGYLAKALGALLLAGYKRVGFNSGYNRFVSANIDTVSLDADLVGTIDYSLVDVSTGSVAPVDGLSMTNTSTGKTINWDDNSDGNAALPNDKVYVAIVRKASGQVVTSLGARTRNDQSVDIAAQYLSGIAAGELAVYAFATRADGSDASSTVRLASGGGTTPAPSYSTTLAGPNGSAAGVTLAASAGDVMKFNELTTGGSAPANMDINMNGAQVASVAYLDRYNGKPFSFTHGGVTRTGAFAATVNL